MTLIDTSVWVDHLRSGNSRLTSLLQNGLVMSHPFVIGELACGNLKNRSEILTLLQTLPSTHVPDHLEVLHFLESQHLFGMGLGWVDVTLLASARLTNCGFWTADGPLRKAAANLGIQE